MKEEPSLYSFNATLFAFISFVFVFVYNISLGNSLDCSLLRASIMACFSFFPLRLWVFLLDRLRQQRPLEPSVSEQEAKPLDKK